MLGGIKSETENVALLFHQSFMAESRNISGGSPDHNLLCTNCEQCGVFGQNIFLQKLFIQKLD